MRMVSDQTARPGRARAVYEDDALSFTLKSGATLRDLADHLALIEDLSGRKPIAVDVKFDA